MLEPCPACRRHVAGAICPFCGAAVAPSPPRPIAYGRFSRAALVAGLAGCWTGHAPAPTVVDDMHVDPPLPDTGTIEGLLTDTASHAAMGGVAIALTGNGRSEVQTTRGDGRFRFRNVPPGTYMLRWGNTRFTGTRQQAVTVTAGTVQYADLALDPPSAAPPKMPYGAPPSRRRIV